MNHCLFYLCQVPNNHELWNEVNLHTAIFMVMGIKQRRRAGAKSHQVLQISKKIIICFQIICKSDTKTSALREAR